MADQDLGPDVGRIFGLCRYQPAMEAHDGGERSAGPCQFEGRGAAKTIADGCETPVGRRNCRQRIERRSRATAPGVDVVEQGSHQRVCLGHFGREPTVAVEIGDQHCEAATRQAHGAGLGRLADSAGIGKEHDA